MSKEDKPSICAAFFIVFYGKLCGLSSILLFFLFKVIWLLVNLAQIIVGFLQKDLTAPLSNWLLIGGFAHVVFGAFTIGVAMRQEETKKGPGCGIYCTDVLFFILHVIWWIYGIVLVSSKARLLSDETAFIVCIVSLCLSFIPLMIYIGKMRLKENEIV